MPFVDFTQPSPIGGTGTVRMFDAAALTNGNVTIPGASNFQGPTLSLFGFVALELWLFMSANNAGTNVTARLATIDPSNEPNAFSLNTGLLPTFGPGAVAPGLVGIWKRFYLDFVTAGIAYVPCRSALYLSTGGVASNLTITNAKMFANPTY